jgi:O-antigen/teichoic acid export membrane protein
LFVGAAGSVVGAAFARFLALASTVVIARILGVENFGQLVILQSTLGMFGVFAGLGLGVVATKFAAELKVRDPIRLGQILSLVQRTAIVGGALIAIVLALSSNVIATQIIHIPHLAVMIALASASVFFLTVDGYNNSALLGFEAVRQSVLGALVAALLSIPLSIALTWAYGLQGAIGGIVLASILQCVVSHWVLSQVLKKHNIRHESPNLREWKVLRDYALPALLGGAMVAPVYWLCQVLLINTPNGVVEMAVLGIGLQWFQAVYFFPLAFGRIVLPVMTDVIAGGQNQHANIVLKSAILANALVALPMALLIGLLSHWIMHMYGITHANAWLVLSLMVAAATISATCAPVGQVMVAKGKIWYGSVMKLGWAVVCVGMTYLLLGFGAVGVAGGLVAAYIMHTTWVSTWVLRNFKS